MKLRKRHHLVYWTFVWTLTEISALPDVPSQGKETYFGPEGTKLDDLADRTVHYPCVIGIRP